MNWRVRAGLSIGAGAAALAMVAGTAQAAPAELRLAIRPKPLAQALTDLAGAAKVSINLGGLGGCGVSVRGLRGRYSLPDALDALLSGTGCTWRRVGFDAVDVGPLPARPRTAQAQSGAGDPTPVETIVVEATRRPSAPQALAYPISVIGGGALAAQGVRDAADLAVTTPSMVATNLGAGRDKLIVRGLSDGPLTGRTQSMVGVYFDDLRLTYNAPDPALRLTDMAQAEVLRGPQGALYGSGSMGGVVRLVTTSPDRSGTFGRLSVGAGDTAGGAPSGEVEAMANLAFAKGRGAARAVAYREIEGGYIDDLGQGRRDVNRTVRQGWRLAADVDVGETLRLDMRLIAQSINADDAQYATPALGAYVRATNMAQPHDNDFTAASLGLSGVFDGVEIRSTVSAVRHSLDSRFDATGAALGPADGPVAFDEALEISTLMSETVARSTGEGTLAWLAGAFFAHTDQTSDLRFAALATPGAPAFTEQRRDELDEQALFGEATFTLSRQLHLTLGGRAFRIANAVASQRADGETGAAFSGRDRRTGFAPLAILAYQPRPGLLLYLQGAEGYRAGGFNTTAPLDQGFGAAGGAGLRRAYGADELWSLEAGLKAELFDQRLSFRAAAFEAWWRNIQSDLLATSGLPYTANIGDGRNAGVEIEAAWRSGGLTVTGGATFMRPELDRPDPAFASGSDLSLSVAPDVSGALGLAYVRPLARGRSLEANARLAYFGPSRLALDGVTSPRMGDYVTARLSGAYGDEVWRVRLTVDNPLGGEGDTFAYGDPFTVRHSAQATPLRPRTVRLGFTRTF